MKLTKIKIKVTPPVSKEAMELTQMLFLELEDIYGKGKIEDFASENSSLIYFIVLVYEEENIACGGVRKSNNESAELKRMYVKPEYRGQGISKLLLSELEKFIKSKGYKKIILETGVRQPEAVALYKNAGYKKIPCFGHHLDDPESICFGKELLPE